MHPLTTWFSAVLSSTWAQLALDVAVKATVLLVLAALAAFALRRSSAAVRHRVWCLTFAGLLLLPALSAGLPEWRLEVLPQGSALAYSSPLAPREENQDPAWRSEPTNSFAQKPDLADLAERERLFADRPPFVTPGGPLAEREDYYTPAFDAEAQDTPLAGEPHRPFGPLALAVLWLLGAMAAAAPLGVGLLRNYWLRRRAQPVAEAAWTGLLDELRARLSLRRRVALYETRAALMPMTWGMLAPVVLLPHAARAWTERLRRFVLFHELAHVKRCDVGFQMLARLACALYWFHPLVWYALRRLRIERELACDDCVVQAGERPSDYAAELLEIARNYRPLRLAAAVPMAQTSNLERRIRALFDRACSHLPVSRSTARLLLVGMAITVTTVAVIRLAPRAAAEADEPSTAASSTESSDAVQPPSAGSRSPSATDRQPGAAVQATPLQPKSPVVQSSAVGAAASVDDDVITVSGKVLDLSGKPQAGARVRVVHVDTEWITWIKKGRLLGETKANADGAFTIDVRDTAPVATREHFVQPSTVVLADMPGQGFDWSSLQPGGEPLSLQLVDDAAIEGRILDLEGRPIAGVRVSVDEVSGGATDLDSWIETAKSNPVSLDPDQMMRPIKARNKNPGPIVARYPGNKNLQVGAPELMPSAVTGRDGRFRLLGLGRDRQVQLQLDGAGIAKTWLTVVTHDMPPVPYPGYDPRFRVQTCFGRQFDLTAEPEQHITGVIRDADTGEPLPGVEVRLTRYADSLLFVEGFLSATTDGQGRYLLRGVPKPNHPERTHCLRLMPAAGQPYFRTEANPPKQEGLGPVSFDVALKPAVRIHGQITDATTGDPVLGLVAYYPFLSNKTAVDFPNFNSGLLSVGNDDWYATDQDGRYEIPVVPGRGIVMFAAWQGDRYAEAEGSEAIADLYQADGKRLNIYHLFGLEVASAVREIDAAHADTVFDIKLRRLDATEIEFVDPAGKPLVGVVTRRLVPVRLATVGDRTSEWSREALSTAVAELIGGQDQSRTAMFVHRQKNLAAALRLSPKIVPPNRVVLHPCAAMVGRVIDHRGMPVSDFEVSVNAASESGVELEEGWKYATLDRRHQLAILVSDRDGNFHIDSVPPGVPYILSDANHRSKLQKITPVIQPGETLDLGDVVLGVPEAAGDKSAKDQTEQAAGARVTRNTSGTEKSRKPPMAKASAAKSVADRSAKPITLRGRVLLPDGTPAARADLYWPTIKSRRPSMRDEVEFRKRAAANDDGRFELRLTSDDLPATRVPLRVITLKRGYGLAWHDVKRDEPPDDMTLRLVDDQAIRGRVTDTEGRAVAGARVAVNSVLASSSGSVDGFLQAFKQEWNLAWNKLDLQLYAPLGSIVGAVTDAEGRFELSGVGVERVAEVEIAPRGYMSDEIRVVNRPGFDAAEYNQAMLDGELPFMRNRTSLPRLSGPVVDFVAEAEWIIRGTVFTAPGRTPVAGATVSSFAGGWGHTVSAATDADGRYELRGLPRNQEALVSVGPREDGDLLRRTFGVPPAKAEGSTNFDVELKRGIVVVGRVYDRATGQGLKGGVRFVPLPGNAFADQPGYDGFQRDGTMRDVDADGRFRLVVIPGPGVVMAQVWGDAPKISGRPLKPYRLAVLTAEERQRIAPTEDDDGIFFTAADNSIEQIDNAVKIIDAPPDAKEVTCDLPVEPGKTVRIAIEDEQGEPLSGAFVAGLSESWPITYPIDEASCTVYALGADRPRRLCLLHRERHLAGGVTLTGDEDDTMTVRLGAAAGIAGRVVDESGAPLAEAKVIVNYARLIARELDRFADLEQPAIRTDAEGRFQVIDIVPGERFVLDFKQGDHYYRANLSDDQRQLQTGQKLELENIKTKFLR